MKRISQPIKRLLQSAYQNNQVATLIFNNVTYTGTVDFISASTVYLGLAAGASQEIPLTGISQVKLHQLHSWWHLYENSRQ
ncbi:hypothetical protein [Levilactobacillus cerevisiae]|uniref:hypothetical protein n=1 Tax=Levilactobacillus cerevisiae TaxID=1704076 RepID=UPI001CDB4BBB|nr:hypothetical protein [Levilactobacillus cerevisiae]